MDKIDKKIIAELQKNGRVSLTELAEKVGVSLSPCQRRLKQLEQQGVIRDYQANVDPQAVGLHFAAIVFVKMQHNGGQNIREFEQALQDIPQIIHAQSLLGDPDFILHIVTQDVTAFQELYDRHLTKLPHVSRLSSTLVMKDVVARRALPI